MAEPAGLSPLDAFLPSYEFAEQHWIAIDADAARADGALRSVTFGDIPLMRVLLFLRGIRRPRADETVGQVWRLRRGPVDEPPATAVVDFRAEGGRLTKETRVHVEDPGSRRKFARYWRVIRPFSGLTRTLVLRAAKRRAEEGA